MRKISTVAEDVSVGNLRDVGFDTNPGGELGILAESFEHLTRNIISIVSDMQVMTKHHTEGDRCLQTIAQVIMNSLTRANDFAARYGGEEFAVVLPNTNEAGARMIAERILENVRECNIPHEKSDVASYVTLSIGISTGDVSSKSCMEYIKRADEALYQSKTGGRNRSTFLPFTVTDHKTSVTKMDLTFAPLPLSWNCHVPDK